ncbi:MAG: DUF2029 domain-containing protein [Planctomycetes bacterium]|nr:DUF2029 domain-containing protein [Planctomycetota bacterium]
MSLLLLSLLALGMLAAVLLMVEAAREEEPGRARQLFIPAHLFGCGFFLAALATVRRQPDDPRHLGLILAAGLLYRVILLPTTPILEDDYFRYLWDGKVLAHGMNPYEFAPAEVLEFQAGRDDSSAKEYDPERAGGLAARAALLMRGDSPADDFGPILRRVNYPKVPTVYPPMAQALFALAYWMRPGSLLALKSLVVLFELLAMAITLRLLADMGCKRTWIVLPAWCPLLLKEFANSGHQDSLAVFWVMLAAWGLSGRRPALAGLAIGIATLSKVYPIALLVLYWRPLGWRGLFLAAAALFLGYGAFLPSGVNTFQGLKTFAQGWQFNAGVFTLARNAAGFTLNALGFDPAAARTLSGPAARVLCGILFSGVIAWLAWHPRGRALPATLAALLALTSLFLLSPVVNPWYLTVLAAFAALHPSRSALWLLTTLPLSYLHDDRFLVPEWIRVVEYAPALGLLVWDLHDFCWRQRGSSPPFPFRRWDDGRNET